MATPDLLPLVRTGFDRLDNWEAPRRAPRTTNGLPLLNDPTQVNNPLRVMMLGTDHRRPVAFDEIDRAYDVDSYVRQGVDKYLELVTKQGWHLDSETREPVLYLKRRFTLMGIMTGKSFAILIDELLLDYIKYGNAFVIKKRGRLVEPIPGVPPKGAGGLKFPVLGYFRADPKRMKPIWSADNRKLLSWEYQPPNGKAISYPIGEVIHLPFNVQAGQVWGSPGLQPVLEDIRAYRQCEEYVLKLLYKHLNPLMHHEVPDVMGNHQGRQEDVDSAHAAHTTVAPDGFIITPPGHKIQMIGAESKSLRGEGYMQLMRERIYAGLVVNAVAMGEGDSTSAGSADAMTVVMHNRAKTIQRQFGARMTDKLLFELLLEGGFDPTDPLDFTQWRWHELETEALLARENHEIQKWLNGLTTRDEARRAIGLKPLEAGLEADTYVFLVKIPELEAQAEARASFAVAGGSATSGGGAQSKNRARPANQHGTRSAPKIRPTVQ